MQCAERTISVSIRGNTSAYWAKCVDAGTSSSHGRATTPHAYRDGRLIVKWDLENQKPIKGAATRRILDLIAELEAEGLLGFPA